MEMAKRRIADLKPAAYNPRKDLKPGEVEFEKIRASIERYGYISPIIINRDNTVIGGHQRLRVLEALGYDEIDCVTVDISPADEKALNLALNKISGEWDHDKLADLLQEIRDLGSLDITGFTEGEYNKFTSKGSLAEQIGREIEQETRKAQAEDMAEHFQLQVRKIAEQQPELFTRATAVIVPTQGSEVLIISDPALADFLAEVRRLADAGIRSPLERILETAVSMRWN